MRRLTVAISLGFAAMIFGALPSAAATGCQATYLTVSCSDDRTEPGIDGSESEGTTDSTPSTWRPPAGIGPCIGATYTAGCVPPATDPDPAIPAVTISDLASFTPAAPTLASQPEGGVGVKNLPTNIVATSTEHDIAGTLLGRAVAVRFTPAGYTFDHGDGTTRETATGGQSWEQLREPQFTATDTSHVYGERGTFTLTVTARYTAAVNFGDGVWRTVDGTVASLGPAQPIEIFEAKTALVQYTCLQRPDGPGC